MSGLYKKASAAVTLILLVACTTGSPRSSDSSPTDARIGSGRGETSSGSGGAGTSYDPVRATQQLYEAREYSKAALHAGQSLENPSLTSSEREALWSLRLRSLEATNNLSGLANLRMSDSELSLVARESSVPAFRSFAFFKLGESKLLEHKQEEAREYFLKVLQEDAKGGLAARAQEYLGSIETLRKVEPKTIGVVLPLTGRYANVAQRTLRGIQLGLGLNGKSPTSFRLAVMDSEGNPDLARQGVARLVQEDNVIAIIGGLLSRTAAAEASQASELVVPMVTLSLKSGVTELGSHIFRNSLTSEMQVRQLVKTAIEDLGFKRFAILYPNDAYGVDAANLFWDEALARGAQVTAAQVYSPKDTDYRDVIRRLVGTYYSDARAEEYRFRTKEVTDREEKKRGEKKGKAPSRKNEQEAVLSPILHFDAIFIPDGLKALGPLARTLAYQGVKGVKLLGTNLWNVEGVAKRAETFATHLVFSDGFSSADSRFKNSSFVREYEKMFAEEPGLLEVQGYDSALILRQLISQGASSRTSLSEALASMRNVPGLLSPLSVTEDREILRPVVTLTHDGTQIVPLRNIKIQ